MIQIAELRQEERRISLSVPQDPGVNDWKQYSSEKNSGSFGTLGTQLRKALNKKKG